jgi:hypothetical protein
MTTHSASGGGSAPDRPTPATIHRPDAATHGAHQQTVLDGSLTGERYLSELTTAPSVSLGALCFIPDAVASGSIVHSSAVAHAEPQRPAAGYATAEDKEDPSGFQCRGADDSRSQVIYWARMDPTTIRPASRATAPDASRHRTRGRLD